MSQLMTVELNEHTVNPNPFQQFRLWFDEASSSGIQEPNALALATADRDGKPSVRMVLMKGYSESGFTFYTNYLSRKGRELLENPSASLLFHWQSLERQIRIEGTVTKVPREESNAYFQSRPLLSRLGAIASMQSEVIPSREFFEHRLEQVEQTHSDGQTPIPPSWGGYRLEPRLFEFWQGRPNRLHDRLRYALREGGSWIIERLSP